MQARRHERGSGQMVGGAKRTKRRHKGLHEGSISVGAGVVGAGRSGWRWRVEEGEEWNCAVVPGVTEENDSQATDGDGSVWCY